MTKSPTLYPPASLSLGNKAASNDEAHYSPEAVAAICKNNRIDHGRADGLRDALNFAATIYKARISYQKSLLTNKEIKEQFEKLERQATKLSHELAKLPPQLNRYYQAAHREMGDNTLWEKRLAGIAQDIQFLAHLSAQARQEILPDKAGRDPDNALGVWVKMMADFWVDILQRDFTFDTHQSIPMTEAGRFLVDCMTPLDADAIPRISSQMRLYAKS